MRTTVHLPDDLLQRAKRKAAAEGRTLTSLIAEGLRIVLAGRPAPAQTQKRKLPRISKAAGGLLPGIDPIKIHAQLEEAEDLDRLRRSSRRS